MARIGKGWEAGGQGLGCHFSPSSWPLSHAEYIRQAGSITLPQFTWTSCGTLGNSPGDPALSPSPCLWAPDLDLSLSCSPAVWCDSGWWWDGMTKQKAPNSPVWDESASWSEGREKGGQNLDGLVILVLSHVKPVC